MSRCQWMMSRGYHKGCQCGNDAVADNCGIELCALHLGMATTKPVCNAGRGCITEHGRWRDRKGNCQGCGKPASESPAPRASRGGEVTMADPLHVFRTGRSIAIRALGCLTVLSYPHAARLLAGLEVALAAALREAGRGKCLHCGRVASTVYATPSGMTPHEEIVCGWCGGVLAPVEEDR